MSFIDALLHEALLQEAVPMDVYIALRSDGAAAGSGTEADPYSGATLQNVGSSVSISLLEIVASPVSPPPVPPFTTRVKVTTSLNHNFKNNDLVLIEGVSSYFFNGTFAIAYVDPTHFTCDVVGRTFQPLPEVGPFIPDPPPNPPGGTCRLDPYLFDRVMRNLPTGAPLTVRLGPGLFETKGYSAPADLVAWRPQSGMKILGAGIGVTILKLVGASYTHRGYHAIGCPELGGSQIGAAFSPLDGFEASDFTVDCNIANQPNQAVTCGAIFIHGRNTRLRRIRAINFGRQGTVVGSLECFVLGICGPNFGSFLNSAGQVVAFVEDVPDCVVEECIVEQPGLNNVRETTCIIGLENDVSIPYPRHGKLPAFQRSTVVRNCTVNGEYQEKPIQIASIGVPAAGLAKVTTRGVHGLSVGQWIRIDGAFLGGLPDNAYNGSYQVSALPAPTPTEFYYSPSEASVAPGVAPDAGSPMWVGRWPSHFVAIDAPSGIPAIAEIAAGPLLWVYEVTTKTAHFLVPGSTVIIGATTAQSSSWYEGLWTVSAITDRRTFRVQQSTSPGFPIPAPSPNGTIGVRFQAVSIGGASAVMEGNVLMNCRYGGSRRDTGSLRDVVMRNNYYRSILLGPAHLIEDQSLPLVLPVSLSRDSADPTIAVYTVNSVYVTSALPVGLTVGQGIRISGVPPSLTSPYNGTFVILSLDPAGRWFKYRMLSDPIVEYPAVAGTPPAQNAILLAAETAKPPLQFFALPQFRDFTIENNVFELLPGRNDRLFASAVFLGSNLPAGYTPGLHFTTRRAVIRNNIVRYVSTPSGSPVAGYPGDYAFSLKYCEDALVENNSIDLPGASHPLFDQDCKSVRYFNNTSPGGVLRQGESGALWAKRDELTTLVDEALLLGFL